MTGEFFNSPVFVPGRRFSTLSGRVLVESFSRFDKCSEDNQEEMGFMMGTTRRRFLKTTGTAMGAGLMLP
ncbi:MAG: twin-arginine translocation signal domain-containing protein, partial [Planctomycetaceae bacterium]|nr:twin-arginine translocation signal domain-containing protein [Planctomycetaceae bacterium]